MGVWCRIKMGGRLEGGFAMSKDSCAVTALRCLTLPCGCRERLARRAEAASFEFDVAHQIDALDPRGWDLLSAENTCFLRRPHLALLEAHGPGDVHSHYALVRRHGRLAAALRAQVIDVTDEILAVRDRTDHQNQMRPFGRAMDRAITWTRNTALGALGRRVMICGDLFSCGTHGVAFAPGQDDETRSALLIAGIQRLQDDPDIRADYAVVKDLPVGRHAFAPALHRSGFSRLRIEPSMELALRPEWKNFDDYLDALNAKYRKAAHKVFREIDAAGARIERTHDLAPHADALHQLYLQVERRAEMRFGVLPASYFPALARHIGPADARCTLLWQGENLVGFSLVLRDGPAAVAHVVGFDYEANAAFPVYLRLLYSVIEDALDLGCAKAHFGRTALEPKARLGALPEETEIWVRHRNPLVNLPVGPLLNLAPQNRPPQRDPFKH